MKNIILGVILFALVFLGYFLFSDQSQGNLSSTEKVFIHNENSITNFLTDRLVFTKKSNDFYLDGRLIEHQRLKHIFDRLQLLKIDRVFEDDLHHDKFLDDQLINIQLRSAGRDYQYQIGAYSHASGKFFLRKRLLPEKQFQVFLVEDTFVNEGIYRSESEAYFSRFASLLSLFHKKASYFYPQKILPQNLLINRVTSLKNEDVIFQLNFQTQEVTPVFSGKIKIDKGKLNDFFENLVSLNYTERIPRQDFKGQYERNLLIETQKGQLNLKVFSSNNSGYSFAVELDEQSDLYAIEFEKGLFLLSDRQYFWDKKIDLAKKLVFPVEITFQPTNLKNIFTFLINKKTASFSFEVLNNFQINESNMQKLLNAILPSPWQYSADGIEPLMDKSAYQYRVKLLDHSFAINLFRNKLVIADLNRELSYYFNLTDATFRGNVTDLFSDFLSKPR